MTLSTLLEETRMVIGDRSNIMGVSSCVIVFVLCAWFADAVYFRLHDHTPVCFTEEVTLGSEIVAVDWSRRHSTVSSDVVVYVLVLSPQTQTTVYTNKLISVAGSFSFKPIAGEIGEYSVCFSARLDASSSRYVELSVAMDYHDRRHLLPQVDTSITRATPTKDANEEVFTFTDFDGEQKETLKTHDYLAKLQMQIATAQYQALEVADEVTYYHIRQKRLRDLAESTFDRVWMLSAATIALIVGTSYIQFGYLKRFLRRKKLV